ALPDAGKEGRPARQRADFQLRREGVNGIDRFGPDELDVATEFRHHGYSQVRVKKALRPRPPPFGSGKAVASRQRWGYVTARISTTCATRPQSSAKGLRSPG